MRIRREHTLGKDEARRRVEQISADLASKYSLCSAWEGDDLKFSGTGVNGCILVGDDCIDVDVKLGFSLMLLESTIRLSVEQTMDEHLD